MKRSSTLFLQVVILLIAIGALAGLILEPQTEGRNAHADLVTIYFRDPFLAYVYVASIPFFVALYQAFKLLGYIDRNEFFSQGSVKAVRIIKYCATALIALILGAEAYIFIVQRGKDDIAGGVAMGLFMIVVSVVIATAAAVFQKLLQSGVDIKSENDLTV
jgi:hypothetical protein